MSKKRSWLFSLFVIFICAFSLINTGCGNLFRSQATKPFFTDPLVKISQTESADFMDRLAYEASLLEPAVLCPGTQVYMGYWSYYPNRASLIRVLDSINTASAADRAIWDEGVTTSASKQYPSYIQMNDEFWYERGNAVAGIVTLTIEGVTYTYTDPYPTTFQQADTIWGQYSQRYAEMAALIRRQTGITPEALCFVQNARSNRIFYSFELPKLVSLEATGDVRVFFAVTSEADWNNPSDWVEGTKNAPVPVAP
ncbi:MAG: hypothetical protein WC527_04920 [Candidatus Margulisiibacteriota bacterium]